MLIEDLQYEGGGDEVFRSCCRSFAEGLQRLDFLTDLTDDLTEGRLYLPQEDLDRFGVSRADLERGRVTPSVGEFVAVTCRRTRKSLTDARALVDSTTAGFRPLQRALPDLAEHQLSRVESAGTSVTRRGWATASAYRSPSCSARGVNSRRGPRSTGERAAGSRGRACQIGPVGAAR